MADISGLSGINYIGSDIILQQNDSLRDLPFFEQLGYINGALKIVLNPILESLLAFDNLRAMNGGIKIHDNPKLLSLTGLDRVNAWTIHGLNVYDNSSLSTCHMQSTCRYFSYDLPVFIQNNAVGCNSQPEVQAQCGTVATENVTSDKISIYPNPTSGLIELIGIDEEDSHIRITDSHGKIVTHWDLDDSTLDISTCANGLYFIFIEQADDQIVKRVIKN